MTQNNFEKTNSEIIAIYKATGKTIPDFNSGKGMAISLAQSIIDKNHSLSEMENYVRSEWEAETDEEALESYQDNISSTFSELFDFIDELSEKLGEDDFYIEYDGNEYRCISDSTLWDTYKENIENTISECYDLSLDNIPDFIACEIDWDKTAQNCLLDGYAHTFSSYDRQFHVECADYNVFWTN